LSVAPGEFVVLGLDQSGLDGAAPNIILSGSGFYNTAARFQLMLPQPQGGAMLVDTTPELDAVSGVSWSLSGDAALLNGVANDNPAAWCRATISANGFSELGSPGAFNEVCP